MLVHIINAAAIAITIFFIVVVVLNDYTLVCKFLGCNYSSDVTRSQKFKTTKKKIMLNADDGQLPPFYAEAHIVASKGHAVDALGVVVVVRTGVERQQAAQRFQLCRRELCADVIGYLYVT